MPDSNGLRFQLDRDYSSMNIDVLLYSFESTPCHCHARGNIWTHLISYSAQTEIVMLRYNAICWSRSFVPLNKAHIRLHDFKINRFTSGVRWMFVVRRHSLWAEIQSAWWDLYKGSNLERNKPLRYGDWLMRKCDDIFFSIPKKASITL